MFESVTVQMIVSLGKTRVVRPEMPVFQARLTMPALAWEIKDTKRIVKKIDNFNIVIYKKRCFKKK